MDLDAARVDEQAIGYILGPRKRAEDTLPNAALGPAHEAVVERLLRTVDVPWAIGPAPAAFQRMDDPAQHTAIVDPIHAAHVGRQERLDPSPLNIRKPKEISHLIASPHEAMNHNRAAKGIPLMGPDPNPYSLSYCLQWGESRHHTCRRERVNPALQLFLSRSGAARFAGTGKSRLSLASIASTSATN